MTAHPPRLLRALHLSAAFTLTSTLQAAPTPVPVPVPSPAPSPAPSPSPSAAAPPPAPATPSPPAPSHVSLWLDLAHSGLDKAKVRAAIEQELGAPVELTDTADTPLRVVIESDQRLRVSFITASGEELSRTVDLPTDPERRVEVIALMVGNLTRNEAADLLAALQAAKNPPPTQPQPKPTPKPTPPPSPDALIRTPSPAINLSLYHPLALYPNSDRRLLRLELGLAYSHVGGIEGAALSLGGLRVEQHLRGFAFGGFFSIVGGPVHGVQSSYIYSESRSTLNGVTLGGLVLRHPAPLTGVAVAGLVALNQDVEGLGLAGLVNVSRRVNGADIGGVVAVATEPVDGLLLAGVFASSKELDGIGIAGVAEVGGDAQGIQIAGLTNIAGNVRGLSLSGLANITGDVQGLALSVVNVGQHVRGAQIGVVNVAGEVDGVQVGLVNIAKNGRIQAEAFATNTMPINAGIRFVSGYSYSELALGYDPVAHDNQYSGGVGAHFELAPLTLEVGVHGSSTQHTQTNEKPTRADLHYRARIGWRITSFCEPFLGGGARHGVYGIGEREVDPEILAGVALF